MLRSATTFLLLFLLVHAPAAASAQVGEDTTTTPASPVEADPAAETGQLSVSVDAGGAINALVHWKIREGHLQVRVDGVTVVDRTERKPPRGLLVYDEQLPAGEHVIEIRWDVTFRSATDRHHPLGSGPDQLGFAVPAVGFARTLVTVHPHARQELVAQLHRRSAGGLQGDTWVEWEGVDPGDLEPPVPGP